MKIINLTKKTVLAQKVKIASSLKERLIGLIFTNKLSSEEALVIRPCKGIHTFFMRFAIDVIFLDNKDKVIKILHNFSPNRISRIYPKAKLAIELPAGKVKSSFTELEDRLLIA